MILILLAAACTREPTRPTTRLSIGDFVAVMTELELSQPHERAAILQRHHTSEADLRNFATAYASDPAVLSLALDSIQARVYRAKREAP